jgi:hypothetical protein
MNSAMSLFRLEKMRGLAAFVGWCIAVAIDLVMGNHPMAGLLPILLAVVWTAICFSPELRKCRVVYTERTRNERPLWLYLFAGVSLCAVLLGGVQLYATLAHKPVGLTANEFAQPYLRGYSFRLVDLASSDHYIRNKTLEDCWIYGPAIITYAPGGETDIVSNTFIAPQIPGRAATVDEFFIAVPGGTVLTGVITLENCTFRRCHFIGVQFIGCPQCIKIWEKGFAFSP